MTLKIDLRLSVTQVISETMLLEEEESTLWSLNTFYTCYTNICPLRLTHTPLRGAVSSHRQHLFKIRCVPQ